MPRASIIIATRNRPHLLPRAVQSARASGHDVDVIVVDDASSPQTAEVCKQLSGIRYIRLDRNQGSGGARNVGLIASRAEYISFLDDDDIRLRNSLDQQIQILDNEPSAGLIYGQALVAAKDGAAWEDRYPVQCAQGDIFWQLLTRNFIPCGSVVFRRSCLSRVGLFDDGIFGIEDWDLWVRISEIYPILALQTPVIVWRQSQPGSEQLTSRADQIVTRCVLQFRAWMKLPRLLDASRETRQILWRNFSANMGEHLIRESIRALRSSHLTASVKNLAVIPRLHPFTMLGLFGHRVFGVPRPEIQELLAAIAIQSSGFTVETKAASQTTTHA